MTRKLDETLLLEPASLLTGARVRVLSPVASVPGIPLDTTYELADWAVHRIAPTRPETVIGWPIEQRAHVSQVTRSFFGGSGCTEGQLLADSSWRGGSRQYPCNHSSRSELAPQGERVST